MNLMLFMNYFIRKTISRNSSFLRLLDHVRFEWKTRGIDMNSVYTHLTGKEILKGQVPT